MARKKSRFMRIKRLLSVLLLLAMFLVAGLLPPAFAYMSAKNSTVQSLPDAQDLIAQGRKFYEAERFNDAAVIWQQAVAALKANGDELRLAMTLGNLSLAYQQLGQWTEAQSAIAQSLNLLRTAQNINTLERSQILAQALDIQGRLQLALSQPELALNTWQQAVDIYTQIGDNNAIIRNRINSAQARQALGLYRQAQKTLTESTQLLQNQPDSPLKVTGLRSLGNVLLVTGDLEQSRSILQQSLEGEQREKVRINKKALQVPHNLSPPKPSIQHIGGSLTCSPIVRQQKVTDRGAVSIISYIQFRSVEGESLLTLGWIYENSQDRITEILPITSYPLTAGM